LGKSDLNKGPVLWRGVDLSETMAECLEEIAAENDIDIQRAAWNRFTPTNASHIMKSGPAVQTTLISIPHRYPHGPNGVVAQRDIANLIELLCIAIGSRELMDCVNFK
jgi:putative aminopeptidase FrvX